MKLTITIAGVVNITERWEVGSVAHEQRYAGLPAQPVELSIEHSDVDAILGQAESFLLSSVSNGQERVRMPSTVAAQKEIGKLDGEIESLKGTVSDCEHNIASQRNMIDTMSVWKGRANEAGAIIAELDEFIGGVARLQAGSGKGQAVRLPKGLRKRIGELRSDYPVPF